MTIASWLKNIIRRDEDTGRTRRRRGKESPAQRASRCRPAAEALEERLAPAVNVTIDPTVQHQTILGWGASSPYFQPDTPVPQTVIEGALNLHVTGGGLTFVRFDVPLSMNAVDWDGDPN